jgi:hypothetical protein
MDEVGLAPMTPAAKKIIGETLSTEFKYKAAANKSIHKIKKAAKKSRLVVASIRALTQVLRCENLRFQFVSLIPNEPTESSSFAREPEVRIFDARHNNSHKHIPNYTRTTIGVLAEHDSEGNPMRNPL